MKAILYELYVPESTMDWIHGSFTTIRELYIPDFKMCFNSKGFAFKTDAKRYAKNKPQKGMPQQPDPKKIKTIDMISNDVADIERIVNQRLTIDRLSEKYFDKKVFKDD